MQQVLPLHVVDVVQGKGKGPGTDAVAGVARAKLKLVTNCLRDSNSGFDLGVYSRNLSTHGVNRETAVVWN